MNFKRIIMIMLLLFIIPISSVTAANEKYDEAYELLNELGIADEAPDNTDAAITRGEFVELYFRSLNKIEMLGDGARPFVDVPRSHKNYSAICSAYNYGYVNGYAEGSFCPDDYITPEECISLAQRALGYQSDMSAEQCVKDLYKNISFANENVSYRNAVIFIYNMMNAGRVLYSSYNTYKIDNDNTILGADWDVFEIQGQITANSLTALDSTDGCQLDAVKIDDVVYECENKKICDMLGYYVSAYVREIDSTYCIISATAKKGKAEYIKSYELYDGLCSDNKIEYYKEGDNKKSTLRILPAVQIIYNDVFAGSQFEPSILTNMNLGEVTAIDSDGDGYYDVLKIYDYSILTAGNYTTDNAFKIFDLYKKNTYINFEKESVGDVVNVEIDGKEALPSDIMTGDVLAYYENESSHGKILNVRINRTVRTGTLEIMNDRTYVVDGKELRINPIIKNAAAYNYGKVPTLGVLSTFSLDFLNQIVLVSNEEQPDLYTGVFINIGYDSDTESFWFKILTQGNSVETYDSESKITINGVKIKSYEQACNVLGKSKLNGCTGDSMVQLINYKLKDGKVASIYTTEYQNEKSPQLYADLAVRDFKNLGNVFGTSVREFRVNEGTVMFTIPGKALETSKPDLQGFFATKTDVLLNGAKYNCQAYDVNEAGVAETLLVVDDIPENYGTSPDMYLVASNKIICDENDEIRRELELIKQKVRFVYKTKPDDTDTCCDIEPGDIINLVLDPENNIAYTKTVLDISAPKLLQGYSDISSYLRVRYLVGYLSTFSNGWGYLTYDRASSADITAEPLRDLVNVAGVTCSVYNVKTKTVTDGAATDFAKYISMDGSDYLIFYTEAYGQGNDLVVYDFN